MMVSPSERGFSLTEILIAVAILGMMGTMTFGTFNSAVNSREVALEIAEREHEVRLALERMAREISMAFLSAHRDCDTPKTKTIFKTSSSSIGTRLDFTSFSHLKLRADANESDQNELSYFVDRNPDNEKEKCLLRRVSSRIDDEPTEGGRVDSLLCGVNDLEFEFYDHEADDWEDDWDSEDSDYKNRLPLFAKFQISLNNDEGDSYNYRSATRLFMQKAIFITGIRCSD